MVGKKAVILLSGGIDSATAAVIAKQQGFELHALSYHYGQRHERELESAKQVARFLQANSHRVIHFDLRAIGGSALTDHIEVPKGRSESEISQGIPVTYVPARNTIFLSFAVALAELIEAQDIFLAQINSITAAIRTAATNIYGRLKKWRISLPKSVSKAKAN